MTNSIPNLIVDSLYYGNSVLLPSVGILSIQRIPSQIMAYENTLTPPYDTLILDDDKSDDYNIDVINLIAKAHQVDYNIAYNYWNEYLDTEAGDNILTIENLAMINLINCELLAIDPGFAQFLSPDNEIQTLQPIAQNNEYIQIKTVHNNTQHTEHTQHNHNQSTEYRSPNAYDKPPKKYKKQTSTFLATIITIGSVLYIAYYFALKNNLI